MIVRCGDRFTLKGTECRVVALQTANSLVTAVRLAFTHEGRQHRVWVDVPLGSARSC